MGRMERTKQSARCSIAWSCPSMSAPVGSSRNALLERHGYRVDDHWLRTRAETDAFKAEHGVETTPQTFIGGGGSAATTICAAFSGMHVPTRGRDQLYAGDRAVRDDRVDGACGELSRFTARRSRCGRVSGSSRSACVRWRCSNSRTSSASRPCSSTTTCSRGAGCRTATSIRSPKGWPGVLMIAGALMWLSVPVALVIGSIGAVSVVKAVYIDKRELKCACVGGIEQRAAGVRVADRKPDDGGDGNLDDREMRRVLILAALTALPLPALAQSMPGMPGMKMPAKPAAKPKPKPAPAPRAGAACACGQGQARRHAGDGHEHRPCPARCSPTRRTDGRNGYARRARSTPSRWPGWI